MSITKHKRLILGLALAFVLVPLAAQAQRRSPLADAPAIRKRLELRSTRLEFGAGAATTINQDFFHTVMLQVKLGFHFNDWLSLSGVAGFAVANMATGFQDRLSGSSGSLGDMDPSLGREPTKAEAAASMTKINQLLGAQLEFTPFTGKYSMFGKLFAAYDVYLFVGPGLLNVEPTNATNLMPCTSTSSSFSCGESGFKFGANFGVGFHSYFNQWLGLNIELRDILAQLNPSGRDVNGDQKANTADQAWNHTYMFGANLVVYLPTVASISQ
jgi:outer membrane beta-barrel protein